MTGADRLTCVIGKCGTCGGRGTVVGGTRLTPWKQCLRCKGTGYAKPAPPDTAPATKDPKE